MISITIKSSRSVNPAIPMRRIHGFPCATRLDGLAKMLRMPRIVHSSLREQSLSIAHTYADGKNSKNRDNNEAAPALRRGLLNSLQNISLAPSQG
jgi:hypothetical protein